jgi:glucose/arabinose dehydrogenase
VSYSDNAGDSVVARYQVSAADPNVADPTSAVVVITQDQPYANHNGGQIAFGPDGLLYVALGDGGSAGDPLNSGQTLSTLLGKLLRLDVDGDDFPADPVRNYAIPPDNPFVGTAGDDEIWAYGLRNPWRASFDRETGDLYVGDVGLDAWEEVNVEPAASPVRSNFGWDVKEGPDCFDDPDGGPDPGEPACEDPSLIDPVYAYSHDEPAVCHSITGGAVYRGASSSPLVGRYFFSDFCGGWLRSLLWDGAGGTLGPVLEHPLLPDAGTLTATAAIVEDGAGELVIVDYDGDVFRLVPEPETSAAALAAIGALVGLSARGRSARPD